MMRSQGRCGGYDKYTTKSDRRNNNNNTRKRCIINLQINISDFLPYYDGYDKPRTFQ